MNTKYIQIQIYIDIYREQSDMYQFLLVRSVDSIAQEKKLQPKLQKRYQDECIGYKEHMQILTEALGWNYNYSKTSVVIKIGGYSACYVNVQSIKLMYTRNRETIKLIYNPLRTKEYIADRSILANELEESPPATRSA